MSETDTQKSDLSDAQQYAWNSFEYHAKQRMDVFRFYLILVGLVFVGAFRTIEEEHSGIAILILFFLIFITFIFYRLDIRGKELVKISEEYLKYSESAMSKKLSNPSIAIISLADQQSSEIKTNGKWYEKNFYSFSQLFHAIYLSVFVFSILVIANIAYRNFS
jgi:hypothetical protein